MLVFMIITFGLFWVVIKNNLLYVVRTGDVDGGALFFPSAINQTFVGLYFMEICLIGLFFLVRDLDDNVTCEAQGIIMSLVLVCTACYQWWLVKSFQGLYKYSPIRLEVDAARREQEHEMENWRSSLQPSGMVDKDTLLEVKDPIENQSHANGVPSSTDPDRTDRSDTRQPPVGSRPHRSRTLSQASQLPTGLRPHRSRTLSQASQLTQAQQRQERQSAKRILARLNRPLDERRLAELEKTLSRAERRAGNILVPRQKDIERQMMNDPISKIIMQHNDELENLDAEDRDMLTSVAFTHPVLRDPPPSVWIPSDDIGVSEDEVRRTRLLSKDISIDNRGAFFNKRLKVRVNKPPPDMSEFALVMAEL